MADEPKSPYRKGFDYRGIAWNLYTTRELLQRCEKYEFRPEDIIVATVPRSGTTITQEMVWHIVHHKTIEKDVKEDDINHRFPNFELDSYMDPGEKTHMDILDPIEGGRLIKTHLPYFMIREQLEKAKPKIIVTMRNPKDNAVARYHFHLNVEKFGYNSTWPEFLDFYLSGRTFSGDFFNKNLEWWALRDRPNVLILRYEDLVTQPHQEIRRIASFLDYHLTPEEIDIVAHNTSFQVMSANLKVNLPLENEQRFLRKGQIGEWKTMFTVAQNEMMDRHIERKLRGSGLGFRYE